MILQLTTTRKAHVSPGFVVHGIQVATGGILKSWANILFRELQFSVIRLVTKGSDNKELYPRPRIHASAHTGL